MEIILLATLLVLGYTFGQYLEKRHYRDIIEREKKYLHLPVISGEWKEKVADHHDSRMVSGSVVISSDYFKNFTAGLRSLFGGRLKSYETLIDRGRREAILRMKEEASHFSADQVINLRIETSMVGGALACVEVFAYGTAVKKDG